MQNSVSPNKRSSFRSRTKGKQIKESGNDNQGGMKTALSFKMYMKEFPLGISDDIVKIVENFQPIHSDFLNNLGNLRLYKSNLASQFENSWSKFMDILRIIIVKMNKRNEKMIQQKEQKIVQVLNINSDKQEHIKKLKQKIDNIENLRQLENAQLAVANNQIKMMNKQMTDIYAIMQNDMGKILKYLTKVEEIKDKQAQQGTQKFFSSLEDFSKLLNNMQAQQKQTGTTLETMRQMTKAMARSTKISTGTQVDESQLQTQAANIFSHNQQTKGTFEQLDGTALNTANLGDYDHAIDKLKVREKDYGHQSYHPKKSTQKPWALTPTLLIFLQNMSKQNEAGRVLPWEYMKTVINQVYTQRIQAENEITSGMVGSSMLFDQFVVFYFLKKYKIRRLTQVKLLEFIISLKYYSKFWVKAQLFCCMMDVMKYIPSHDSADSYPYRMDQYTQNFFLQVYKRISNFELVHEQDGTMYVPTKKVKKLMKLMLFFIDQMSLSRCYSKLDKDIRIFQKVQHIDFDYATFLFLQQFFTVRKRNANTIGRLYSKLYEKSQGFISIDEILSIFNEFSKIYKAGQMFPQKYPVESPLQISKVYLYAITSGKNDYQVNSFNFLQACQRYGFDSPFPFIHKCGKIKQKQKDLSKSNIRQQNDDYKEVKNQQSKQKIEKSQKIQNLESKRDYQREQKIKERNINQERVDVTSKLFSQHFSIIKELNDYTQIFSKTLTEQQNSEVLWKSFNQIKFVLQRGCKFLNYPLIDRE